MDRRLLAALGGLLALAGACREGTVVIEPRPEVGDRARYRYEIEATITRALDGGTPTTNDITTDLLVDQEVLALTDDGVEARVTLRRDGGAPRSAQVVLDRSGAIRGIELVEGLAGDTLGLAQLSALLPPSATPPGGPLAPGATWTISDGPVAGHGRLDRLGVVDGSDVAFVETDLTEDLTDAVAAGASSATLEGELRSDGTIAYDVHDGSIRRSTARSRGEVRARIQPPAGVDAEPALATITYEIRVRSTRLR